MHAIATHIQIRKNRDGQDRAYIDDTRVRVQDVASMAELQGRTPDEIAAALSHLTLAQIHAALSYYFDHREEIQREIREDQEFVVEFRKTIGASILEKRLKPGSGPSSNAVSPG